MIKLICIILFILIAAPSLYAAVTNLIPVFQTVLQGGDGNAIKEQLRSFGFQGVIVMVFLQTLQLLTVVVPAPVIWVIGGATYGIFFGMLICLVGINIAGAIAFTLSKKIGTPIITRFFDKNKNGNFLSRAKHPEIIIFILFIVPGIPNGIMPYLAGMTKISLRKYLITTSLAITPSILMCTLVGDQLASGRFFTAGIIIAVILIFAVLFFLYRKKIYALMEKLDEKGLKK
ncbi:MAG: hypothetical protein BGN88_11715 [Clostridiales bacterium 43-6]|nr:MAG: hypothetical protein BGN88_11715 [Clostridiales bacterium 43-6]